MEINHKYPLVIYHGYGKWPIEIADVPIEMLMFHRFFPCLPEAKPPGHATRAWQEVSVDHSIGRARICDKSAQMGWVENPWQ